MFEHWLCPRERQEVNQWEQPGEVVYTDVTFVLCSRKPRLVTMVLKLVYLEYLLSHSLLRSSVYNINENELKVFMEKYVKTKCVTLWHQDMFKFTRRGGEYSTLWAISSQHTLWVAHTSKMWSPGASLPSRAASESRTISWMTMFPRGVSFPPTMRKPSSSSGSLYSSTVLASATRLDRRGVLSRGKRKREQGQINTDVFTLKFELQCAGQKLQLQSSSFLSLFPSAVITFSRLMSYN